MLLQYVWGGIKIGDDAAGNGEDCGMCANTTFFIHELAMKSHSSLIALSYIIHIHVSYTCA